MNILLIDDDLSSLKNLTTSLKPSGHRCESFTDPLEAVKMYPQHHYDVVITDMKMPGMNGIEMLKKIRAHNSEAKVIIITAYGDVEMAISAVNNRAYAFLSKPINFEELMGILEKVELENKEEQNVANDKAKLLLKYAKLKQVYEDLQVMVNKKRSAESPAS